jgi:hypothetical protein
MRRAVLAGLFLVLAISAIADATIANVPTCAVFPGHSTCDMKVKSGGRIQYANHGPVRLTLLRNGVTLSRTCTSGEEVGSIFFPSPRAGDVIQIRALSSTTTGLFAVSKLSTYGGAGDSYAYPC